MSDDASYEWRPVEAHHAVQDAAATVGDLVNRVHRARNKLLLALVSLEGDRSDQANERVIEALIELGEERSVLEGWNK